MSLYILECKFCNSPPCITQFIFRAHKRKRVGESAKETCQISHMFCTHHVSKCIFIYRHHAYDAYNKLNTETSRAIIIFAIIAQPAKVGMTCESYICILHALRSTVPPPTNVICFRARDCALFSTMHAWSGVMGGWLIYWQVSTICIHTTDANIKRSRASMHACMHAMHGIVDARPIFSAIRHRLLLIYCNNIPFSHVRRQFEMRKKNIIHATCISFTIHTRVNKINYIWSYIN